MATSVPVDHAAQIGETAGMVWKALSENGPLGFPQLVKAVGQPRDAVMQAVGWLAREDKVVIQEERRRRVVALR